MLVRLKTIRGFKIGFLLLLLLFFIKLTSMSCGKQQDSLKNWMYICNSNSILGISSSIDTVYQIGSYLIRLPNETKFMSNTTINKEGNVRKDSIFEKLWRIEVIDLSKDTMYVFNDDYNNPKLSNKILLNTSELIGFNIFQFKSLPEKIKKLDYEVDYIKEKIHKNKKCVEVQFISKDDILCNILLDQSLNTPFDIELDINGKEKVLGAIVELNYISEGTLVTQLKLDYVNMIPKEKKSFFRKLFELI